MVYAQEEREGEESEHEAGQGYGHRLADGGGARASVTKVAGERRRRGPTILRVADVEVVLLACGRSSRWSGASGRTRLQCKGAL